MRLIDADALAKSLIGVTVKWFVDLNGCVGDTFNFTNVIDYIEDAPTIDAKPVLHGRWVVLDECANAGAYCSVCHKKVYKECYGNCKMKSTYCPNCGAKMDGDQS